jgi:hypothetical protein
MRLPASTIRSNLWTWSVPAACVPAVALQMTDALSPEQFDPNFLGQWLQTTYFDTQQRALRKARLTRPDYVTLRLRSYAQAASAGGIYPTPAFAVSAKTQDVKTRVDVAPAVASQLVKDGSDLDLWAQLLPPDILARLLALAGELPLMAVVTATCTRYATEDDNLRLTLDTNVCTDSGKALPFAVLEFKAAQGQPDPPGRLPTPGLRPLKLSKFLWSTDWR